MIKINGKIYETFKDENNILRFKPNNLILKLKINFDLNVSEIVKLVELEAISLMDLLDFYAGIGFSISGVQELSFFEQYDFVYINDKESVSDNSIPSPQPPPPPQPPQCRLLKEGKEPPNPYRK